ncbi:hypothetical protein NA57DRAFT_50550 [Rhizodiscina lignyota]|uniref:Uncharacterized protein n=1 Tax=Rhizodiscina lignyota TaxID=1504668 RepID=A0A9P4MA90_9PEZI|nr:hypothetical protein NA57DRAFT_50550 [Rhizodiscina lignyota]
MSSTKKGYNAVPQTEDSTPPLYEDTLADPSSHRIYSEFKKGTRRKWLVAVGASCVAIMIAICSYSAGWITHLQLAQRVGQRPAPPHLDKAIYESHAVDTYFCGSTVAEAKERGCVFDVLAPGWLPRECQDLELLNAFRAEGPWTYWADKEGTAEIPESELQNLEYRDPFWTTQREHATHCAYTWRKMHRFIESGRNLEGYLRIYNHTVHCGDVFMKGDPTEEINTLNMVGFGSC